MNSPAPRIGFGSDNHSGVHPEIFAALQAASIGHAPSYGTDEISERVEKLFANEFGAGTKTFFVFNGTAANVLALESCLQPFQSVLCSEHSHIFVDECGAPERYTGAKLISIPSADAKLTLSAMQAKLIRRGDQHHSQAAVISLTQPTELGTVYTVEEIKEISSFAKKHGLYLHIDGARLVNAASRLGVSLQALTRDCGVDVLSLGGTKNGLMFGEAVVFFRDELAKNFKYRRKQAMQLPSKTRFVAAQFEAWLGTDLWKRTADHANRMAQLLARELAARPFVRLTQKVEANAVFVQLPKPWVARLRESYFFYVWNEHTFECRLMTTFDTTEESVFGFVAAIDELQSTHPRDRNA